MYTVWCIPSAYSVHLLFFFRKPLVTSHLLHTRFKKLEYNFKAKSTNCKAPCLKLFCKGHSYTSCQYFKERLPKIIPRAAGRGFQSQEHYFKMSRNCCYKNFTGLLPSSTELLIRAPCRII